MENMKYNLGSGALENWLVAETVFNADFLGKCEAIFCQGNGYLGIRHSLEESYVGETRNTFVTGTFNKFSAEEVTELPNFPDVTAMDIYIDGDRFSLEKGEIKEYERVLNLLNGEVLRKVVWVSPKGKEIKFLFRRFVSFANEHILGSAVEILPVNDGISIRILSGINKRVSNSGSQHFEDGSSRIYEGKYIESIQETTESKVKTAVFTAHNIDSEQGTEVKAHPIIKRRGVYYQYDFSIGKENAVHIEKISGIYTTRDLKYRDISENEAREVIKEESKADFIAEAKKGYKLLFEKSEAVWREFWNKNDITINSEDGFDQLGIRFAQYHLNIMIKRDDNRLGIGAKALSGEGYKGHSFWDTEIFLFPYYMYTDPKAARTLLEYRYHNLYGARKKAAENGFSGAQYPWESAWIDDGEVTPLMGDADVVTGEAMPILTGLIEIHISADVAFAVDEYYRFTGDTDFMEKNGYEIIFETAKFWLSKMEKNEKSGKYEILDVIGPDEYKEHIDNNAYTNYMAHHNMKLAKEYIADIKESRTALYEQLDLKLNLKQLEEELCLKMEELYLPQPDENGIIPQFDGYFKLKDLDLSKYKQSSIVGTIYRDFNMEQINEYKVSKQGDIVVLFFLLRELFDKETVRKNFLYYEEKTLHDSSLSKCTHGIMASELGLEEMAYKFYKGSASVDLGTEMRSSDMGIHSASMGGVWQSVVMGFAGVRLFGNSLSVSPRLPKEWSLISFNMVWRGQPLGITIDKEKASIKNNGEESAELMFEGLPVRISGGEKVDITLPGKPA